MNDIIDAKRTIWDILKVSLSNMVKMFAGILVGFLLPKIIGVTDYGYFKTFTLYSSYVGLLHFGFADGIYLKYGGKKYEELERSSFRLFSTFIIVLELLIAAMGGLIALFFLKNELKFIFICLAVFLLSTNVISYYQIISQITSRFNELSLRTIIHAALTCVAVASLWVIYKIGGNLVSYRIYTIVYISINFILMLWYVATYRDITFGKMRTIREEKATVLSFFKMGFPLLFANLCSTFILSIDRQFVNVLFDTDTYAVYAFAYNMLSLITTALAAISTVLYPTLKRTNRETLKQNYPVLNESILIIVFICIIVYFPLRWFVPWFLPKYVDSLPVFRVILPGLAVSSAITIVMHNYYKTEGKELLFFIKSIIILLLSAIANLVAYLLFRTTIAISIASIIVMIVWYVTIEEYFVRMYQIKWIKNLAYMLLMTCGFYLITIWNNWWATMLIYLTYLFVITFLFYWKDINNLTSHFFKKTYNKNGCAKSEPISEKKQNESSEKSMTVMVTGVAGQLGHNVVNELRKRGIDVAGSDIYCEKEIVNKASWNRFIQLDVTSKEAVDKVINDLKPDAIIHCAAWTNVDGAEDPNNKPLVKKINVDGTDNLVKASKKIGAKFMYISTDYVFNGEGKEPWKPDDKDYASLNYYGQTKLEGELSVSSQLDKYFIVRIAWVFGLNGKNFIKTMLSLADKGYKELKVVDDQIGTPTYTYDLARLLVDMIETDKYGYYHATNEGGYISWADFAEEIFRQAGKDVKVKRVSTAEYGISIAKRPFNSRLDKSKLVENGFKPLPDWKDAIKRYLEEIKEK